LSVEFFLKYHTIPKYSPRFEVNRQGTTSLRKSLLTSKSGRAASRMVTLCEAKFGGVLWGLLSGRLCRALLLGIMPVLLFFCGSMLVDFFHFGLFFRAVFCIFNHFFCK
jgi:hypothetical protein